MKNIARQIQAKIHISTILNNHRKAKILSRIILCLMIGVWSLTLGSEIALAITPPVTAQPPTIDSVPNRYQPGYDTYMETCTSCHVPIPPGVLPTESWRQILEKPGKHYGVSLPPIIRISQLLMWDYLSAFSRPLAPQEPAPTLVQTSRYFKALHPRVQLPPDVTPKTCLVCHPGAQNFNYRTLTPEWENSP